uniref:Uncharacterized protein n=1 Tax=Romanomermis culicivorax TaxID=13658 RepID=A0A915IT82_ROMCU
MDETDHCNTAIRDRARAADIITDLPYRGEKDLSNTINENIPLFLIRLSPYVYHTKFSCLPRYSQQIGAATAAATTINCCYEQMNVNRMEQLQQQQHQQTPQLTPRPVATMPPASTLHNVAAVYGNAAPAAAAFRSQYKQTVASLVANNVAAAAAVAAYGLTTAQPASGVNNTAATAAALMDPGSFLRDKSAGGPVSKSRANASSAATYYLACGDSKIANGLAYSNYHTTDAGSLHGSLINHENHTIESNVGDSSSWLLCQLT